MGRLAFRAAWDCTEVQVVHINEIKGGAATAAHLLEFDSVHGRWSKSILQAIEAEEFAELPGGAYSTSYIRLQAGSRNGRGDDCSPS